MATLQLEQNDITLLLNVYTPKTKAKANLIVFHAANEQGKDDERLVRLAKVFARAGFLVYTPTLPSVNRQIFHPRVIDEMAAVIEFAEERRPELPTYLLSFSVAVGPELIVAAREETRDKIDLVIGFGGYFDMTRVREFHLTGQSTDPFGRQIIETYLTTVPAGQTVNEFFAPLDPRPHLPNLKAETLLLHSRQDQIIPFAQSEKLFLRLKALDKPVTFIALQGFDHVNPVLPQLTLKTFFNFYLPEFARMHKAAFLVIY